MSVRVVLAQAKSGVEAPCVVPESGVRTAGREGDDAGVVVVRTARVGSWAEAGGSGS